jgi:hypothetical protein
VWYFTATQRKLPKKTVLEQLKASGIFCIGDTATGGVGISEINKHNQMRTESKDGTSTKRRVTEIRNQ